MQVLASVLNLAITVSEKLPANPPTARYIHELLRSSHCRKWQACPLLSSRGCVSAAASNFASERVTCQYLHPSPNLQLPWRKNACRPPAAPPHAASCSVAHVCNSRVRNLYRSPKEVRLQRHSRVTAEQELRLQRHTSQEQDPRAKAHADNGMTCVRNNR